MVHAERGDVVLIAGGDLSEHAISLLSARAMGRGLLEAGFRVRPVLIGTEGSWWLMPILADPGAAGGLPACVDRPPPDAEAGGRATQVLPRILALAPACAVLALHGRGGEDGRMQGLLESVHLPYTGSGISASALASDKQLFKLALLGAGFRTPSGRLVEVGAGGLADLTRQLAEDPGLPLVVKPVTLGSSVGIHVVHRQEEIEPALRDAFAWDPRVLAERLVSGRELSCPVIGRGRGAVALPVIEIVPRKASWFDAASKYEPGGADEIVPARIAPGMEQELRGLALEIHRMLGARGITRTDVIVDELDRAWILETNTAPGMTDASLVPKSARAAGLQLADLMRALVADACEAGA